MSVLLPKHRERAFSFGDGWAKSPAGLYLPPSAAQDLLIAVELFAGAGGMSCGFVQAGFHCAAAAEGSHEAALTYLCNLGAPTTRVHVLPTLPDNSKRGRAWQDARVGETITAAEFFSAIRAARRAGDVDLAPGDGWISTPPLDHEPGLCATHIGGDDDPRKDDVDERRRWFCETYHAIPPHRVPCEDFYLGDIYELTGERVCADLGLAVGDVDLVAGGPPCQGFSYVGKRNVVDPRNSMVFEFARLVLEIRPRAMIFENVPGIVSMTTPEGIPVVDALCRVLEDGGFGAYNALRRSLLASSGAGAAVRGRSKNRDSEAESEDADEPQLAPEVA